MNSNQYSQIVNCNNDVIKTVIILVNGKKVNVIIVIKQKCNKSC